MRFPSHLVTPRASRAAHLSRPWLKRLHLIRRLLRENLVSLYMCLAFCPLHVACCAPLQTVTAMLVGQKAMRAARTLGWGCVCANPTSRGHTVTSALQATMDPSASVSDSGLAAPCLPLLTSLLLPTLHSLCRKEFSSLTSK